MLDNFIHHMNGRKKYLTNELKIELDYLLENSTVI